MRRPFLFVLCDLWPVWGLIWWWLYAVKLFADTHTHTSMHVHTQRSLAQWRNSSFGYQSFRTRNELPESICWRSRHVLSSPNPPSTTLTRPKSRTFTESVCSIDFFKVKFRTFFLLGDIHLICCCYWCWESWRQSLDSGNLWWIVYYIKVGNEIKLYSASAILLCLLTLRYIHCLANRKRIRCL